MGAIIPAILPGSRSELETKLEQLKTITDSVQIDIIDGIFSAPATWPYDIGGKDFETLKNGSSMLPLSDCFRFEMDLMVDAPETVLGMWIDAGAARITVHVASTRNLPKLMDELSTKFGHDTEFTGLFEFGLAITIDSDFSLVEPYLDRINYLQLMGIRHIGRQGEPFDPKVLEHVHTLHKWHPRLPLQVDGGVSRENAGELLSAGVSRLIVGSHLWLAPDLKSEYQKLNQLALECGIYE